MKIRHLKWEDTDSSVNTLMFDGSGWVEVLIAECDGKFYAHTENLDPPERFLSGNTLDIVKNMVESQHRKNAMEIIYEY